MLVPRYWAEHRIRIREGRGPQTTIRRWGWSGSDQAGADRHARERAEQVAADVRDGRRLELAKRREQRVAYNGAEGVPIREEILSEHPELCAVITRNVYAAHCLNVPDVWFADVDEEPSISERNLNGCIGCLTVPLLVVAVVLLVKQLPLIGLALVLSWCIIIGWRILVRRRHRQRFRDDRWIQARAAAWCRRHPDWSIQLYRTPAGFRLLADHALIDPTSPLSDESFRWFRVDSRFAAMCRAQRCFRARLTGKPWRMGINVKFSRQAWPPTTDERQARRRSAIERYEAIAGNFAACRRIGQVGSTRTHPRALAVRQLHDALSRCDSSLPLA